MSSSAVSSSSSQGFLTRLFRPIRTIFGSHERNLTIIKLHDIEGCCIMEFCSKKDLYSMEKTCKTFLRWANSNDQRVWKLYAQKERLEAQKRLEKESRMHAICMPPRIPFTFYPPTALKGIYKDLYEEPPLGRRAWWHMNVVPGPGAPPRSPPPAIVKAIFDARPFKQEGDIPVVVLLSETLNGETGTLKKLETVYRDVTNFRYGFGLYNLNKLGSAEKARVERTPMGPFAWHLLVFAAKGKNQCRHPSELEQLLVESIGHESPWTVTTSVTDVMTVEALTRVTSGKSFLLDLYGSNGGSASALIHHRLSNGDRQYLFVDGEPRVSATFSSPNNIIMVAKYRLPQA